MREFIDVTGKTEEEAIRKALTQLAQGVADGLFLGLARYVNITHGSISSFDHSAS